MDGGNRVKREKLVETRKNLDVQMTIINEPIAALAYYYSLATGAMA